MYVFDKTSLVSLEGFHCRVEKKNLQKDSVPTFGNHCLSAIGGRKQRSRLAGWVQLSAEAAPGPHGVPPAPPCAENSGAADENIV